MGVFVSISTASVRPSQDFLKESTIRYILDCLNNSEYNKLPPVPIVRLSDKSNEYVAIDGHNLLAVYDYLNKPCRVYIAQSKEDGLPDNTESAQNRNKELRDKFDSALINSQDTTFKQLRKQYAVIADS